MPNYDDITNLVSILFTMREPYEHHGPAVAQLVKQMCHAMGMSREESKLIEVGAYLHDIGKLRLSSELFNNPRKLTPNEREQVQLHAPLGWAITEQAGYDKVVLDIVRHHHENWDGSGYPDGLKETDIPQAARIVHICDVYQSMTNSRSYRDGYSYPFVIDFMKQGAGKQYDPDLLELFFTKVAIHE